MGATEQEPPPHRVISDSTSFEIIRPLQGKRVNVTFLPDGTIAIREGSLTQPEGKRLEAEVEFTTSVRGLITYSLELKAARALPGSETTSHELKVHELQTQFIELVRTLADMHISNREIQKLVTGQ